MIYVAELSINHLGMLNIAKAMIKAAKSSGADYVKIKIKKVNQYYSQKPKKWRGYDFINYRESLELKNEDIKEMVSYCKKIGIGWFSTVHDKTGLDFIKTLKPSFFKVASMDNKNLKLINETLNVCKKNKVPFIVSLGGQDKKETEEIIKIIKKYNVKCYLLHCVSIYPTPEGQSNINYIDYLIDKYQKGNFKVGYSGHEENYAASISAGFKDIHMIERHFTLDKNIKIHHIRSGILPSEFLEMKQTIAKIRKESVKPIKSSSIGEKLFLKKKVYK